MNILHVIRDLSRATGGPVNALHGLVEAEVALGHRVIVLAADRGDNKMVPAGAVTELVPAWGGSFSWSPAFDRRLAELVPTVDVVHGHMVWDYPVCAAARHAHRSRKPFILRPCGHLDAWSLSQKQLKKRLHLAALGSVIHTASAIHFTSEGERNASLAAIGDRPNFVVPLGVPNEALMDVLSPDAFTARFPELQDKWIVLFLGRLHAKKQPEVAIDAFQRLALTDARLHLVLAGPSDASYADQLAARVAKYGLADRVTFTGLLRGRAVREAYAAAKVFVLMSHQENFGIAIAEAMAAACPVIISDQLDLAQDIVSAKAGIVCRASPYATAAAVQRLVSDDALRQRMGANGRALVLRRFTWSLVAATLIDEYRKAINNYEWSGWSA